MQNRSIQKCSNCSGRFNLVLVVGLNKTSLLAFPCPICNRVLRANLHKNYDKLSLRLDSDDLEEIPFSEEKSVGLPGTTVSTDLPVHSKFKGQALANGGSVWLDLSVRSNIEFLQSGSESFNQLNDFVIETLSKMRGQNSLLMNGQPDGIRMTSALVPLVEVFSKFYLGDDEENVGRVIVNALNRLARNPNMQREVLSAFVQNDFLFDTRRLIDWSERALHYFESGAVGYIAKCLEERDKDYLAQCRLFRDDYDALKSLYIDGFELASKYLAFIGAVFNAINRGKSDLWSNRRQHEIRDMLGKRAYDREFIPQEFDSGRTIFTYTSRKLRNDLGHFNVVYSPGTGRFEGPNVSINAIELHVEFLKLLQANYVLLLFSLRVLRDGARRGLF